ncbi:MAG: hypothetical protein ACLQGP_10920, partial [Isosphaeraceae bacterium]
LPDLAARLASDLVLSAGEPEQRQSRSSKYLVATIVAACLVSLLVVGFLWSRVNHKPVEPETKTSRRVAEAVTPVPTIPKEAPTPVEASKGDGLDVVVKKVAPEPGAEPPSTVEAATKPAETTTDTAKSVAPTPTKPAVDALPAPGPIILACALPEIPKSQFGNKVPQERRLDLPDDVDEQFQLLNAPQFQKTPAAAASTWNFVSRTGSGLGGGSALASLGRINARSWQFGWSKDARNQSTQVDVLRDAVLKFRAVNDRAIFVLLRGVETRDPRPIVIVEKQPLLFDRLDPRVRTVTWTRTPEVLTRTTWKLAIRRWKVVLTSPDNKLLRREFESTPIPGGPQEGSPPTKFEKDLIPGEVKLKLAIAPESPDAIAIRIEPDRARFTEGRKERASRREALAKDTPTDDDNRERDPIGYRRGKLEKLEAADRKDESAIKTLKQEIAELERLNDIRQLEDLLTKPVRAELSVVIALDLGDSTILDIVRVGDFAD